jgi:hypothetical protein
MRGTHNVIRNAHDADYLGDIVNSDDVRAAEN